MATDYAAFMSTARRTILFAAAFLLMALTAFADWPSSGLPIATGPGDDSRPIGITAPGGDLLMFWNEFAASPYVLRAQRVTIQGTLASGWPAGGRGVVSTPAGIGVPQLDTDGSDGYLLAWFDFRASGGSRGIYGIRIDAETAVRPGWNASGTPICTTSTPQGGPLNDLVRICPDGAGGAFVAWTDSRNTPPMSVLVYDIFAQHILRDGTLDPAWPAEGLAMTGGAGYKYPQAMIADSQGGFFLVSDDSVTHRGSDAERLGTWGMPIYSSQPEAMSDGAGGLFVTWHDCRNCLSIPEDGIYVMRLGPGAQPRPSWPIGGVQVAASSRDDRNPTLTTSGGAVVVTWLETGGSPDDVFKAKRVEANGSFTFGWPTGGRAFAKSSDILDGWPLIVPDGEGGAMFAFRRNLPNLFGSRVTSTGTVPAAFPDTGLSLCSLTGDQFLHDLVSDGLNGAYVLWDDQRDGNWDVYAMRFTRAGEVGSTTSDDPPPPPTVTLPQVALSLPVPNPTFGSSAFKLSLSASTRTRVEVLDLSGRSVITLLDQTMPAGTLDLEWDGRDRDGRSTPPGMYLLRARAGDDDVAQRIVRLK